MVCGKGFLEDKRPTCRVRAAPRQGDRRHGPNGPAEPAGAPATYGDTWLWNGTSKTWTALNPAGASGVDPRYGQVLASYGPKNLDLMFGGNQGASTSFCKPSGRLGIRSHTRQTLLAARRHEPPGGDRPRWHRATI